MQIVLPQHQKQALSELRRAFDSQRPEFIRAFWFSMVTGLMALAPTIYMFEVYGRVVDARSMATLGWLTLLVVLAYLVLETMEWARAEMLRASAARLDRQLGNRVFEAVFEINKARGTATQTQPLQDLKTLREFLYSPAVTAALELPVSVIFLVLIYIISPLLGLVSLAGAITQVTLGYFNDRRTQPPLLAANKGAVAAQQYADGSLRNAQVIEAMGMLQSVHRRWFAKQREFLKLQAVASERAGGFQSVTKTLQLLLSSGLLGFSAWLLLENALPGGPAMMIVASTLGGRLIAPMAQLVSNWRQVVNFKDSYERMDNLLTAVPPKQAGMPLPAPVGQLLVEGLVAGPPGTNQPILRGLQFGLNPGEVLAVVGPSASGKSTLARLLVGAWPAMSGKVRLDGADVFAWNKEELGPHMGYLPQEVELFEGTLAENIARFGEVEAQKLQLALERVGLTDLVQALPQGVQTFIGRDGAVLSGGQRQRVGLARAIYGSPRLVVLDEPNSSLDEAGEKALAGMIQAGRAEGTTFVVITHRTAILQVVDKMLVLKDGTQQAFGPRDEVLVALQKNAQAAQAQAAQVQAAQQARLQGGAA